MSPASWYCGRCGARGFDHMDECVWCRRPRPTAEQMRGDGKIRARDDGGKIAAA